MQPDQAPYVYLEGFLSLSSGPGPTHWEGVDQPAHTRARVRPQSDSCPHHHGECSPDTLGDPGMRVKTARRAAPVVGHGKIVYRSTCDQNRLSSCRQITGTQDHRALGKCLTCSQPPPVPGRNNQTPMTRRLLPKADSETQPPMR